MSAKIDNRKKPAPIIAQPLDPLYNEIIRRLKMSVLTIIRNTKKEDRIEPDNISVIDWVSLGEGVRIQLLERHVAELEKFIKTHLHSQNGQAY